MSDIRIVADGNVYNMVLYPETSIGLFKKELSNYIPGAVATQFVFADGKNLDSSVFTSNKYDSSTFEYHKDILSGSMVYVNVKENKTSPYNKINNAISKLKITPEYINEIVRYRGIDRSKLEAILRDDKFINLVTERLLMDFENDLLEELRIKDEPEVTGPLYGTPFSSGPQVRGLPKLPKGF